MSCIYSLVNYICLCNLHHNQNEQLYNLFNHDLVVISSPPIYTHIIFDLSTGDTSQQTTRLVVLSELCHLASTNQLDNHAYVCIKLNSGQNIVQ